VDGEYGENGSGRKARGGLAQPLGESCFWDLAVDYFAMPKVLFAVMVIFAISADGQVVVRKFYNKNGEPADSVKSYYYKEGKKGRLIDLSHPGWSRVNDSLKSSVDTVISYYGITGKMKAREIYYEGRLNGPFISYHEMGGSVKKVFTPMIGELVIL